MLRICRLRPPSFKSAGLCTNPIQTELLIYSQQWLFLENRLNWLNCAKLPTTIYSIIERPFSTLLKTTKVSQGSARNCFQTVIFFLFFEIKIFPFSTIFAEPLIQLLDLVESLSMADSDDSMREELLSDVKLKAKVGRNGVGGTWVACSRPSDLDLEETIEIVIDAGARGAGGLSVIELHQLYTDFVTHMGWSIDAEELYEIDNKLSNLGYQKVVMRVTGVNAKQYFQSEHGQHRTFRSTSSIKGLTHFLFSKLK